MQVDSLWACLAGMAAAHKELSTAEIAYAAIDEVSIHGTLRCNIVLILVVSVVVCIFNAE